MNEERTRWYDKECECEWCGKTFHASRYDAKYCSDSCRQQANRHPRKVRRLANHMKDSFLSWSKGKRRDVLNEQELQRIQELQNEIEWVLAKHRNAMGDRQP